MFFENSLIFLLVTKRFGDWVAAFGLKTSHKLREEHIKLNPRSSMRVNLAAQVRP